jgi:hypothetical protein
MSNDTLHRAVATFKQEDSRTTGRIIQQDVLIDECYTTCESYLYGKRGSSHLPAC